MEDFCGICMIHSPQTATRRKSQVCSLQTSTNRIPDIKLELPLNGKFKVPDN